LIRPLPPTDGSGIRRDAPAISSGVAAIVAKRSFSISFNRPDIKMPLNWQAELPK
jgi:hypothetical protein